MLRLLSDVMTFLGKKTPTPQSVVKQNGQLFIFVPRCDCNAEYVSISKLCLTTVKKINIFNPYCSFVDRLRNGLLPPHITFDILQIQKKRTTIQYYLEKRKLCCCHPNNIYDWILNNAKEKKFQRYFRYLGWSVPFFQRSNF